MGAKLVWMRYDAAQGAYEGRVDLDRDGRTFRYPCRLAAPEGTDAARVEEALLAHALRQQASDRPLPRAPRVTWRERADALARLFHVGPAAIPVPARPTQRPRGPRP